MRSFCAHQKGNFLNFSKLTLLLSVVHFWYLLWPGKHKRAFFLRHPVHEKELRTKIQEERGYCLHVNVSIQVCKEWSKNKLQIRSIVNQASWPFQHLNWQFSSGCLWRQIREDGRGDGQMWKVYCWGIIYRKGCFIAIKK